jgi:hypothetical protein
MDEQVMKELMSAQPYNLHENVDTEFHFENSNFDWRENEMYTSDVHQIKDTRESHPVHIAPESQWPVDRTTSKHNFYFNRGSQNSGNQNMPSAPSFNKLPGEKRNKEQAAVTTRSWGLYSYLSGLLFSGNETEETKIDTNTASTDNYGGLTPFSSPAITRPVKGDLQRAQTVPLAYPVPPTAVYDSLLKGSGYLPQVSIANYQQKGGNPLFPSESSLSRKSKGGIIQSLLSPLKLLLIVLSIAVGYLVIDKVSQNHSGYDSHSPSPSNGYVTPSSDSGGSPRPTSPGSDENYLDGWIPSWLLEEFSTPQCQCGSFATLQEFCKQHICIQSMLDSTVILDTNSTEANQYGKMLSSILVF